MRLRMYLRGLGIGIVVTALLMGITTTKANRISDSEIIKRAEALGMVKEDKSIESIITEPKEEPVVSEPIEEEIPKEEVIVTKEKSEEEEKTVPEDTPGEEEIPVSEKTPEEEEMPVTGEEPKEEELPETEESIETSDTAPVTTGSFTIEIAGGTGSEKVSALLEKGGAINSAAEFDEYLCSNGYDHRITVGKHVIPAGSDYETIAKIITSR